MGSGTSSLREMKPDPMPGRTGGTPIPTGRQMHGPAGTLVPTEDGEGRTRCFPYLGEGDWLGVMGFRGGGLRWQGG